MMVFQVILGICGIITFTVGTILAREIILGEEVTKIFLYSSGKLALANKEIAPILAQDRKKAKIAKLGLIVAIVGLLSFIESLLVLRFCYFN